jgi:hypothetical protein
VQARATVHGPDRPGARQLRRDGRCAIRENGAPLDTRGDYYDGTPVTTPAELTKALLKRPMPLVRTFTRT